MLQARLFKFTDPERENLKLSLPVHLIKVIKAKKIVSYKSVSQNWMILFLNLNEA